MMSDMLSNADFDRDWEENMQDDEIGEEVNFDFAGKLTNQSLMNHNKELMSKCKQLQQRISDLEKLYEWRELDHCFVSNMGEVKSKLGTVLKPYTVKGGYLVVKIGDNKSALVSRLVAEAFIPNPLNKRCVNHKDCNKINNCAWNLEWVSYKENMQHAIENDLHPYGENSGINKLSESDVWDILNDSNTPHTELGKKYGVAESTIRAVRNLECLNWWRVKEKFLAQREG